MEHLQQVLEVEAHHGVATHAHCRGDAESALHEVVDHLIGQRAAARDDASVALLEHARGHDADHRLARGDKARAVGADDLHALHAGIVLRLHGIEHGHALGDAHHELHATVYGLEHGILGKRCRHENDRRVGARGSHGLLHGVEHRYAVDLLAALAGRRAAHHLCAILLHLGSVETAVTPGNALDDDLRIVVY